MAEQGRFQGERKSPAKADAGAAVRSPSSAPGTSPSGLPPPSDAPTLAPGSSAPDAPTIALSKFSSSDLPTVAEATPRTPTPTSALRNQQPVLESGAILAGRYEILDTLGEGGMGAVYKARDLELDRMVALKVIRPELAKHPAIIERFKKELLLSQRVTHRNVIRIYDLGEGDGVKFITMEFIEGEDLRSLIHERKKFPPEEAVHIMEQVCLALDAAHQVDVIHRDLKPQNVMRDKAGRILVMDFGLARTLQGDGMTQTGALVGTMEYMSPEQALAQELDQRSDIFSAGLIFYELLTGVMPYRADSALASLIRRTQERAKPISDHDSTIPQSLTNIVSKCLEREPADRYQTAKELLADLKAWQGKRAAATLDFHHVKPWGRTVPWPLFGAIFVALVLAVTSFVFRHKLFEGTSKHAAVQGPITSLAILPFRNTSGDPSLDWLGPSLADMLSTDVGQTAQLRTVSQNRVHQVLSDLRVAPNASYEPATLRRLAEFSNADHVVWGQYAKFGDQIRIDATVQDIKSDRSVPVKIEVPSEKEIPGAVDRLAQSIREQLALSPQLIKELQEQSFKPSSTSVEALRYYSEGLELARQGDNLAALKRLQESVKADPEFALALSKLGQTHANLGYDDLAEQESRRAVELAEGLPAREKYLISANQARIANDNAKAIQAYENLLKVSPDDTDLLSDLAGLYRATGAFEKARGLWTRVLEHDPKNMEALLAMGRLEIHSGNPQAALEYLNRGLLLAIQLGNQEERADFLHSTGVAYKVLNKVDDASQYLQDSLEIKRRLGNKRGIALSLNELGQVQDTLGKTEAALASYREALQLRRDIGDKRGIGDTLIDLGGHYVDGGQYDEALKLYKESLQIQHDVGNENYQALCLNAIGNAYLSKGDYENARTYFEQALQLREKFKVPGDTADTLHNLAETSANLGQYDRALDQYLRALQLYRSVDDKRGEAVESYSIGTVFEYQGRYGAAVSSKQDALKAFRELKDRSLWMAEILSGCGHALAQAGRGDEAQANFEEALSLARELKNQTLIAQTLDFQGDSFFYRGDLRGARRLYQQAVKIASHSSDHQAKLRSNLNLLKVAVKEGAPKDSITALKSLAEEADGLGLKYLSIDASLYVAQGELATRDYSGARQSLERNLARSDKLGLRTLSAQAQFLLGTALRLSGNQKEAVLHYKESVRLLDEIRNEPGGNKVLQRPDLNSIYTESTHWSTASQA
jgi:eukaryotic-like serine/threonine-protein kinase